MITGERVRIPEATALGRPSGFAKASPEWNCGKAQPFGAFVAAGADTLMRVGVETLFHEHFPGVDCIATCDIFESLDQFCAEDGAFLLLHVGPGDMQRLARRLRFGPRPACRFVVLSGAATQAQGEEWLKLGAAGVLDDGLDEAQCVAALTAIANGDKLIALRASETRAMVMERLAVALGDLKPRALRIVDLLCEGCSNAEIAAVLGMTERAVKWHMTRLLSHLRLRSRYRVVALVTRLRLARRQ
jgi:DNA-binding NarL/FixJ family response regulator